MRVSVAPRLIFVALLILSAIMLGRTQLGGSNPDTGRMAVITEYFGITAEEIESIITIPMEEAVSSIAGITELKGMSEFSRSRIDVRLSPSRDQREFSLELREQVDRVYNRIRNVYPAVQKPQIVNSSRDQSPIFSVAFTVAGHSPEELRPFIEHEVKPSFTKIPGLGEITVVGGSPGEIHVEVDPERAVAFGYSTPAIASVIRNSNTYQVLGRIDEGTFSLPVTFEGRLSTIEDLKSLPLAPGTALEDLAFVHSAHRKSDSISRIEMCRCVSLHIKCSAPNLIHISRRLREETVYWENRGLEADIVYDLGRDLERSFRQVAVALGAGMVLSGGLLLVFTREKRRILVITAGQPILLLISLAFLSALGKPIDSFILAGLAVGIGMVLDTALLMTETIRSEGLKGLRRLLPALFSSSGSTIFALLPLFPLDREVPGVGSLALSLTVLLGLSLVLSLAFLPVFYREGDLTGTDHGGETALQTRIRNGTIRGISWVLNRKPFAGIPRLPVWICFLSLTAGITCLVSLPKDLGRVLQSPVIFAYLEMDEGTAIEEVDRNIVDVAERINSHPSVLRVQSTSRRSGGEFSVVFSPDHIPREELLEHIRNAGREIHNGFLYIPEGLGRDSVSLEVALTGPDVGTLKTIARESLGNILAEPWALEGVLHFKNDPPAYLFIPDRSALAASGISVAALAALLRWNLQGPVADKWHMEGRERDLRVMARDAISLNREDLKALMVSTADGISGERRAYRLDQLGSFVPSFESSRINRLNRQHTVGFTIVSRRMDPYNLNALTWEVLNRITLPPGYSFQSSSRLIEKRIFFRKLWGLFGFTVLFIFLLISVERESPTQALIILLPLPLILSFPLITLRILGQGLGSETLLGLILLVGLGINNGILILDYLPGGREISLPEIIQAVNRRFNGIFLTTVTSVLGLIPLLFAGDPFFVNLALVLVSGLTGSFLVGLFIFPFFLTVL